MRVFVLGFIYLKTAEILFFVYMFGEQPLISYAETTCKKNLITGPFGVRDSAITSNYYSRDYRCHPKYGRIPMARYKAYCGGSNSNVFLQVKLRTRSMVKYIVTQGRPGFGQYVKSYHLGYSQNGFDWQYVNDETGSKLLFSGNWDTRTQVENALKKPVIAHFIRIYPWSFRISKSFRLEVRGCPKPLGNHICWKPHLLREPKPLSLFNIPMKHVGACARESYGHGVVCQAFSFDMKSGICQGYSNVSYDNSDSVSISHRQESGIYFFIKQKDC